MSTPEESGREVALQDRTWRAGFLKAEQLAAVLSQAVQAAASDLGSKGLGVRVEARAKPPGVSGLVGGFSAAHGVRGWIRVTEDGRGCRLVIVRTNNAEGLVPAPSALAREAAAAQAAHREAEATYVRDLAYYKQALAVHPAALEEHARDVERTKRAWKSGQAARAAARASRRGLRMILGVLTAAGGLALTVVIWTTWDISAYYDKVFHTWMVFLVIKILAALVPVAVLALPLVVGGALAMGAFRSAAELEGDEYSPPRPPPRPRAPDRPAPPTEAGLLHDPARMEGVFVKTLTSHVERALAPPARPRVVRRIRSQTPPSTG